MLTAHIYFNGQCKEAIDLYTKAFNADVRTVIMEPDKSEASLVLHAEICIHGQILMMNDFGNNDGYTISGGYQLAVSFRNADELKLAYSILEEDSTTVEDIHETDYSPCVVRFIDKFGVRWGFWCN